MNFKFPIALLCLLSVSARAADAQSSPRVLVHLLEYLSSDYAGAISSDGRVLSESEYREQKEFAAAAARDSREAPALAGHGDLLGRFAALQSMIEEKIPPARVSAEARALKQQVIAVSGLAEAPTAWPSLARGAALYRQDCLGCHGPAGRGDGPAGRALDPKPANFQGDALARGIYPLRAFNSIRLGVSGTSMAGWPSLSDEDTWALAFYVTSLHVHDNTPGAGASADLLLASTRSDAQLEAELPGTPLEKRARIVALRLGSGGDGAGPGAGSSSGSGSADPLDIAAARIGESDASYRAGDFAAARESALMAYLEGIEPVEPRLRAVDPAFVASVETRMAGLRSAIEARAPRAAYEQALGSARASIDEARGKLAPDPSSSSPWVVFLLTAGILLREGFEAVLVLIALLAVIRASNEPRAARFVHAGWIAALAAGGLAWIASGWILVISGAAREKLEGYTSLLAVAVLFYVGFWLHRRTEISRWTHFIDEQVRTMVSGGRVWGLAAISFMAVFREAFETVLFLRAITLGGGPGGSLAMGVGVAVSLSLTIFLSWLLLRTSAKLPIRKIFACSSLVMVALAVILTGKGIHSLQEGGVLSFTYWGGPAWSGFRSDFLGVYPTWESLIPQLLILGLVTLTWRLGSSAGSQAKRAS